MKYSVVAYDMVPLILEGLKTYFSDYKNFSLDHTFNIFDDLIEYLDKNNANILISDIEIPGKSGIDAIRFIHERFPQLKIIILTKLKSEYHIFSTLKSGALAYLYKPELDKDQLLEALKSVSHDKEYFNDPISNIIIQSYVKTAKKGDEISQRNPKNLTRREVQILQLVCEGLTNKQIADGLFISVRTVDAHKNHIMQKLGLKNTAELVKFAIKHGYVKL